MSVEVPSYPWYAIVTGEDLEQGDILEGCPIFFPPDDLAACGSSGGYSSIQEKSGVIASRYFRTSRGPDTLVSPG